MTALSVEGEPDDEARVGVADVVSSAGFGSAALASVASDAVLAEAFVFEPAAVFAFAAFERADFVDAGFDDLLVEVLALLDSLAFAAVFLVAADLLVVADLPAAVLFVVLVFLPSEQDLGEERDPRAPKFGPDWRCVINAEDKVG